MKKYLILAFALFIQYTFLPLNSLAQTGGDPTVDYTDAQTYEIGGIKVTGAEFSDDNAIIAIAGLKVGDKIRIPGPDIQKAMKALWKLRLFTDIQIYKEKTIGTVIFLEIVVQERPRYTEHSYKGAKKSHHDDLNDIVRQHLIKGGIVTENAKMNVSTGIVDYYKEKGFLDATVKIKEEKDTKRANAVRLVFDVDKNDRIKIEKITVSGNDNVKRKKIRKLMKGTKKKGRIFSSSKLIKEEFEGDKEAIIAYYNTIGYKDATIVSDSIWRKEKGGNVFVHLDIHEGPRYFFRNLQWKGNSIYETEMLETVLGIKKGDVYNQELLMTRLQFSPDGRDVSTIYMDNGYLFFRVDPVEVAVVGDSIDLEIRIYEGPQATIDRVIVKGNDRTHEHVIRRELRTRPGQKFSRTDIIRSNRQIVGLGYFNPEALQINTPVNPQRGTVDIEYIVEEKPSDQLELSAGWAGGGRGVIGTLGVSFNNFSIRNIFKKESWSPLPQGDGQRLSLRAQTNGNQYQSYNMSFTEPWLGGKKPTSFTVAAYYTILTNGFPRNEIGHGRFNILGGSIGLGTRLKWPDDYFVSNTTLSLQRLNLVNWARGGFITEENENITQGAFYNFSINQTFTRSSVDEPIYPRSGSSFSLSTQFTLPYSAFSNKDYSDLPASEKFKFLEYHKWRFNFEWYTPLTNDKKLVLKVDGKLGMIGSYNDDIGLSPFEQFQLGGDGFSQQTGSFYTGTDVISLRGYDVGDLEGNFREGIANPVPAPVFDKFNVEIRYPFSLNPSATIYVLAFASGGNSWKRFRDFNPFDVKRSAGMGLRVFLPMFGTLGFDYGLGFDKPDTGIGSPFERFGRFNIILGFEPE